MNLRGFCSATQVPRTILTREYEKVVNIYYSEQIFQRLTATFSS